MRDTVKKKKNTLSYSQYIQAVDLASFFISGLCVSFSGPEILPQPKLSTYFSLPLASPEKTTNKQNWWNRKDDGFSHSAAHNNSHTAPLIFHDWLLKTTRFISSFFFLFITRISDNSSLFSTTGGPSAPGRLQLAQLHYGEESSGVSNTHTNTHLL